MVYRNSLAQCAAVLFALQAVNCFAAAATSTKMVAKNAIAYMNPQEVYGSASHAKDIQAMVAKIQAEAQGDEQANKLMKDYQLIVKELQEQQGAIKPEVARQKQERLKYLENEIQTIYKRWEEKIQAATKREMDKMLIAIEQFARKYGYTAVYDITTAVWVDPSLDVTKELVKYLNEQYNAEKAKTKTAPKKA